MKNNFRGAFCSSMLVLFAAIAATGAAHADDYAHINLLLQSGQATQAIQVIEADLQKNPRDVQLRFLLAVAQSNADRADAAISTYSQLISDYPELPEPYNNLAALYAGRGELLKARATLEEALRAKPDYAVAHENLGDVYVQLARQSYDRAIKFAPALSGRIGPKQARLHQPVEPLSPEQPSTQRPSGAAEAAGPANADAQLSPAPSAAGNMPLSAENTPSHGASFDNGMNSKKHIIPAGKEFPWLKDGN